MIWDWLSVLIVFLSVEAISYLVVFKIIAILFYPKNEKSLHPKLSFKDTFKGVFERIVITLALVKGYPQILIFFGAMKLGTRLKTGTNSDEYNDFFLLGNLYSVALAILYASVFFPNSHMFFEIFAQISAKIHQLAGSI